MATHSSGNGQSKILATSGGIILGLISILVAAAGLLEGRLKLLEQRQDDGRAYIDQKIDSKIKDMGAIHDISIVYMHERIQDLDAWRDTVRNEATEIRERIAALEARLANLSSK